MEANEQSEFFDTKGLASYLNVSRKAVIKWREARRIPGAYHGGGVWFGIPRMENGF